jgi:CBS domain-containing protein
MTGSETRSFIQGVRPFDLLDGNELARVVEQLTPGRFAPGETILGRMTVPSSLFVVAEGVIEEADQAGPVALYARGDSFDSVGLINGRSGNSFVSRNRSTCYLLPAQLFHALARSNIKFREHFQRDLGRRLDTAVAVQQQREASSFLLARLGEGQLHPPVFVGPETTIKQATRLMQMREITALLVRDGDRVGIFTERDVRERLVLMGLPETTPIGDLASYELITLDREDFLFNALMLMTERSIRHVVVMRGGEIEGLFEQADLLSYLSNSSYVIASQVDRATTPEQLRAASDAVPRLIRSLFERGVKARYIARIVTDINRKIFRRVFTWLASPDLQQRCCLIVMGSEGRGEQLLRTDQDNGLIFAEGPGAERNALAEPFSRALSELGYPPCPGDVMTSNPEWSKSLADYRQDLRRWVIEPTGDALLRLAILYDASAVAGAGSLLADLKVDLLELVKREKAFCGHFARATLAFPTPLGFFNRFLVEQGANGTKGLDIKKGGIFPIVHGVRSLALEYQVTDTNTVSRIQALSGRGPFSEEFTADLIEALDFMGMLRLREQFIAIDRGVGYGNIIDVDHLGSFERNLLRDSLKIVKQFKSDVAHHFNLQLLT